MQGDFNTLIARPHNIVCKYAVLSYNSTLYLMFLFYKVFDLNIEVVRRVC